MENSYIPPEYAAQLAQLQRRKALAEMMSQRAMAPQGTQVITGHAVKNAPLGNIARALTAFIGNRQAGQADEGLQGILGQVMQARQQAMQGAVSDPTQAQASMDPMVRNLAQSLVKQRGETAGKAATVLQGVDPEAALRALRDQQVPGPDYALPKLGGPTFGKHGDNEYALIPKAGGGQEFKWAPKGTSVSVDARAGGRQQEMSLDTTKTQLAEWQKKAQAAKETLASNAVALDALNQGAQAGGMEGFKQALRKVGQGFGIQADETSSTEQLSMALGNAVLAKARALAPVTAEDVKRLEAILGSIDTDPTALVKMLTVYNGAAAKTLQDYNKFVSTKKTNLSDPLARDLFSGAEIGYELEAPPGNTTQALRAIAELMSRGGDPSQFAIGGEPIQPGSTFNLPGSGLPEKGAKPQVRPAGKIDPNRVYTIQDLQQMGLLK